MLYPFISICGLKEVRDVIDQDFTYLISILSSDDWLIKPKWIKKENHLTLFFEDIADPTLAHDQYCAPTEKDILNLIRFGRRILMEQQASEKPLELLIHCSAGRSRSPAAGYILLCDWYGAGTEAQAAAEIKEIAWHCWPNPYMIKLADQLLSRDGKMIENAIFS